MDPRVESQVGRIHASSTKAVVVTAGGGAAALQWLLATPGASRTVLEALVPYATDALSELLGYEPRQVVAIETARDMARAAYRRAKHLRPGDAPVAGIACTASLATDRPKRGDHRCHVASWTDEAYTTYSLSFVKGRRDRGGEDGVASKLVLRALAEASCVAFDLPLDLHEPERVEVSSVTHDDAIRPLIAGQVRTVTVHPDGTAVADEAVRGAVLAGSFNPLHEGHVRLAEVASEMLGDTVTFELAVVNVDKPPLEERVVRRRVAQFAGKSAVVVTRAPVYHEKARLLPGCTFVIGWDTAVRVVDPRYYGDDEKQMVAALEQVRASGCRFLVAGRVDGDVFRTLDDVEVPDAFEDIFTPIPEAAFRDDTSSTELRLKST